jgi:hypothetical protein
MDLKPVLEILRERLVENLKFQKSEANSFQLNTLIKNQKTLELSITAIESILSERK